MKFGTVHRKETSDTELTNSRMETSDKTPKLASVALKSLMKILYAARMCRYDLLRATCFLARRISNWDYDCDRRLYRLIQYLKYSQSFVNTGFCGDDFRDCKIALFADADFAGCKKTAKSTTGNYLAIVGPNTHMPLAAISKKQSCVSLSTCESETVSMVQGLRSLGLPVLDLWKSLCRSFGGQHPTTILGRKPPTDSTAGGTQGQVNQNPVSSSGGDARRPSISLLVYEDNQSTIVVLEKGSSQALAHMNRTHRVNISWAGEVLACNDIAIHYIESCLQAADILTKGFTDTEKWKSLLPLIGMHHHVPRSATSDKKALHVGLIRMLLRVCLIVMLVFMFHPCTFAAV